LAYITIKEEGPQSPIIKFLGDALTEKIIKITKAKKGDIIFFGADEWETTCTSLGQVRLEIGKRLNLLDSNILAFCWVVDFPLFKGNKNHEEAGYDDIAAVHHPFTRPLDEDIKLLDKDPLAVRSNAYDIVLNGYEVGGGSMRIHEKELQQKIFRILKIDETTAQKRFGHMLKAFEYGAPPHGGIAPGLDRLVMILQDEPNIREVMAFPKTGDGRDLMLGAPSEVEAKLFKELHIKLDLEK
jgi:aspartyl-tRNA synthetase